MLCFLTIQHYIFLNKLSHCGINKWILPRLSPPTDNPCHPHSSILECGSKFPSPAWGHPCQNHSTHPRHAPLVIILTNWNHFSQSFYWWFCNCCVRSIVRAFTFRKQCQLNAYRIWNLWIWKITRLRTGWNIIIIMEWNSTTLHFFISYWFFYFKKLFPKTKKTRQQFPTVPVSYFYYNQYGNITRFNSLSLLRTKQKKWNGTIVVNNTYANRNYVLCFV